MLRAREGAVHQRQQALYVVARGQFGDHTPIHAVQFHLAEELVREQAGVGIQHRRRTLVTGGFDREHPHSEDSSALGYARRESPARPLSTGSPGC